MNKDISNFMIAYEIHDLNSLRKAIEKHGRDLNFEFVYIVAEILNPDKENNAAYYTDQIICDEIFNHLPNFDDRDSLNVLEPSVGAGVFLPYIAKKYKNVKNVSITAIDIDKESLELAELIFNVFFKHKYKNVKINYVLSDYLFYNPKGKFDVIIGNPPYFKIKTSNPILKRYKENSALSKTKNIFAFFFEKAFNESEHVSFIIPKSILNTPEYSELRDIISTKQISSIIDFGEKGFKGVKIETVNIIVNTSNLPGNTLVKSVPNDVEVFQKQSYITDQYNPTWIIYRNEKFDKYAKSIYQGMFDFYRDRQITSKIELLEGKYRILKSRNIGTNKVVDIENYDKYINDIDTLSVKKYLNNSSIICVPNLSYYPRACFLPKNTITNGSVALLINKTNINIVKEDLKIFETNEFREYYKIARNYGTRSLNIDRNSVFYFGIKRR